MAWKLEDVKNNSNAWTLDEVRLNKEVKPPFAPQIQPESTRNQLHVQTTPITSEPTDNKNFINKAWDKTKAVGKNIDDAVMRGTNSALLGLPDKAKQLGSYIGTRITGGNKEEASQRVQSEKDKAIQQMDSIGGKVGNIAGYITPGSASTKIVQKALPLTRFAPKAGQSLIRKMLGKGLQTGIQEGIAGTGMALTESLIKGDGLSETKDRIVDYGGYGGLGGGIFGGLGQGISQLKQGRQLSKQLKNIDKGYDAISDSFNIGNKNIPSSQVNNIIQPVAGNKAISEIVNYETIKNINQLPTTTEGLGQYISQVNEAKKKGLDFDLQLFAEAKKRYNAMSNMRTNTFGRSKIMSQDELKNINDDVFKYQSRPDKQVTEEASNLFNNNTRKELQDKITKGTAIPNSDVTIESAMMVTDDLIKEARQTGDWDSVSNWIGTVRKKGTDLGQGVQAFSKWSDKPIGKVVEAKRVVDKVKDEILNNNPTVNKRVKETEKTIKDLLKDILKTREEKTGIIVDDLIKKKETDFGEMLQSKIMNSMKPKDARQKSLLKQIISDLFEESKTVIKQGEKAIPPNDNLKRLTDTYKFTDWGIDIRNRSHELLKKEFSNNPEVLKTLDDYFKLNKRPDNTKLIDRVIRDKMQGGENIRDWVKNWNSSGRASKEDFIQSIVKETGLDENYAKELKDALTKRLDGQIKKTRESILNTLTKDKPKTKQKDSIQKLMEKIDMGIYGDEVEPFIQKAIRDKFDLPDLSGNEVKFITETMEEIQGLNPLSDKYLDGIAKVYKLIEEKKPASLSQKVGSGAFIGMLGNFTSPMRNVLGNLPISLAETAANPLARQFDKVVGKIGKTGLKTVGKNDFKILRDSAIKGIKRTLTDAVGGRDLKQVSNELQGKSPKEIVSAVSDMLANPIRTDFVGFKNANKFEQGTRLAFDNKFGRTLENAVSTLMSIGDRPFSTAYFDDTLNQLIKTNNVLKPTEDMIATALQVAQERTFKDSNMVSDIALKAKNLFNISNNNKLKGGSLRGIQNVKEIPQILSQSLIPFAKTPANLVKRGMEYSPLGLIEGAGKLALNKDNLSMMKQREIVDRLTRGTLGTGVLGAGALAYKSGLITPSESEDWKTEKFKQESGVLPNSLKLGNKTLRLDTFQPLATPTVAGSKLMQGDGSGIVDTVKGGVTGALEQYTEMPMLQSIAGLADLFSDRARPDEKKKALSNLISSLPRQYTPSIVKKITYSLDPFERDLGKGVIDNVLGKLPLISKQYPAKVDLYGNNKLSYGGKNSLANTLLNPLYLKDKTENEVSKEILRLEGSNIDGETKRKIIPKEVSDNVNGMVLSREQKDRYQKILGDLTQDNINAIIKDIGYQNMNDEQKAIRLERAIDLARKQAKNKLLSEMRR